MKDPIWEESPGALVALINTGQFVYAQLYTITLSGGAGVLRFTDGDLSITDTTDIWDGRSLRIDPENSRALAHWKRGLDVDTWRMAVLPRALDEVTGAEFPDKINGSPWIQAAMEGALDGADVQVDRAYFAAWPQPYALVATPVGILTVFAGRPAEIDCNDTLVLVTLNDYRELLLTKLPRNTFQAGCRHTLYDAGCALVAATFAKAGAALTGSTPKQVLFNPLVPGGSGTFNLGKITMTTGLNDKFSRTIRQWTPGPPGIFDLLNPFPSEIAAGDTFNAFPGCDKTIVACTAFANLVNFGGHPFIPAAETAI